MDYFNRFTNLFPDIRSLAEAHDEQVLKAWEGLGYYSRARNLHQAARMLSTANAFPTSPEALRELPGVGPYTAGAVASIAFNLPVPAVDANALRVFARLLDLDLPVSSARTRKIVAKTMASLMEEVEPRVFNQAVMEFGALVCRPRNPECPSCPVLAHCRAVAAGTVPLRPMIPESKEKIRITMATGVLARKGRIYIQKRSPHDVWPGLWEFPGGVVEPGETPRQAMVREYREETGLAVVPKGKITVVRSTFTRYLVTLHCWYCLDQAPDPPEPELREAVDGKFVTPSELGERAWPAGHRKLVRFMAEDPGFTDFVRSTLPGNAP